VDGKMALHLSGAKSNRDLNSWVSLTSLTEAHIKYMRETLDYNITLIPSTIIPITPLPPSQMHHGIGTSKVCYEDVRSLQLLNVSEEDLHKRVLPSPIVMSGPTLGLGLHEIWRFFSA
jgi:hypothetical protein